MLEATKPVLQAQNLYKAFGRHQVLRGVSFTVYPGTLVGIVGENGAGKSTLLRILAGELRPGKGEVLLSGALGYCPQAVVLNDALTVQQHLEYFRAAYNIRDLSYAHDLMSRLGYQKYRNAVVGTLSGGTKQKLNLTLSLMHRPGILLLDEPYQGFDWETYLHFWDLVAELRSHNCSILVISHLLFEQDRFDSVYHLQEGKI